MLTKTHLRKTIRQLRQAREGGSSALTVTTGLLDGAQISGLRSWKGEQLRTQCYTHRPCPDWPANAIYSPSCLRG